MRNTKIAWTDDTWNPVAGCTPAGPGCANCYAAGIAGRFSKKGLPYEGVAHMVDHVGRWTGSVKFYENKLFQPWHWISPRRVFVCSMGDLFHELVNETWLDMIFAVMAGAPRHTFQVLTKRPKIMMKYMNSGKTPGRVWSVLEGFLPGHFPHYAANLEHFAKDKKAKWPPRNVWFGVSAENQHLYDVRVAGLLAAKAKVRFVSLEPMIEPIDLKLDFQPGKIDWVIVGAESGRGDRRYLDEGWVRSIRNQTKKAGAAFFYKQWRHPSGEMIEKPTLDGKQWLEYPGEME